MKIEKNSPLKYKWRTIFSRGRGQGKFESPGGAAHRAANALQIRNVLFNYHTIYRKKLQIFTILIKCLYNI